MAGAATLNLIGVILDIIGVVMIFRYALPFTIGTDLRNRMVLTRRTTGETELKPAESIQHAAEIGLGFLVLGFVLQAAGSVIILAGSNATSK